MIKFRRNTHDRNGRYRQEVFDEQNLSWYAKKVWDAHGDIVHILSSTEPMEFDKLLEEIRKDFTNYHYHPNDLKIWNDGSPLPDPKDVALSLVRLIEAGYVECVGDNKEFDYKIYLPDYKTIILNKTDREGVVAFIEGYRETSHENREISVEELTLGTDEVRDSFYV